MIPFNLANQNREIGSPSVNLEKGRYRMRGPALRTVRGGDHNQIPPPSPLTKRHRAHSVSNSNTSVSTLMATMVVLLITACLTSFGFAYYLYTTRWDREHILEIPKSTDDSALASLRLSTQVVEFEPQLADVDAYHARNDPEEKFLSYLPHSGFHNQRIAFENALTLSRLLNRTLLVPPILLGKPTVSYVKVFDRLQTLLNFQSKKGLSHCTKVYQFSPPECIGFFDRTIVPWGWLVDLSAIRTSQHLIQRWDLSDDWLADHLNINVTGESDKYTLAEITTHQYQFADCEPSRIPPSPPTDRQYSQPIHIDALARDASDRRLIQLGSLFGSSRLKLLEPENYTLRGFIRSQMIPVVPQVKQVSEEISHHLSDLAKRLGNASGDYLGAHVRIDDGVFQEKGEENTRTVCVDLIRATLGLGRTKFSLFLKDLQNYHEQPREHRWPGFTSNAQSNQLECRSPRYSDPQFLPLNIPLFVSTDARRPYDNPLMKELIRTFPCTFFLSDFLINGADDNMTMVPVNDTLNLRNAYDDAPLRKHLIPFVDAMVVSQAWRVVGTRHSTFSTFILDVLWRVQHGMEIRQRG